MNLQAEHPTIEELAAFGHGKLAPEAQRRVEQHVAECDVCCRRLGAVPDDTLLGQLRSSSTTRDFDPATLRQPPAPTRRAGEIPSELVDHPRYKIVRLLGVGGMGEVYQAEHRMMERPVALKVISPKLTRLPKAIERFRLEVKAAAKLAHPNIVIAHDADQAGELHFLVMEYVDGLSIEQLVRQKGPLPVVNACNFTRQAALGLQHAHERQMIHRDIKPQNLMVARGGQIKILDFGLARFARQQIEEAVHVSNGDTHADSTDQLTRDGAVLGTPDYMAPEQAVDSRAADGRADIYSLGCTLYFMLSGHAPFAVGTTLDKLNSHAVETPASLADMRADLPVELLAVLNRMLAKDPAARYQKPSEVAKALAPWSKAGALPAAAKTPDLLAEFPLLSELPLPAVVPGKVAAPWKQSPARPSPISTWWAKNRALIATAGVAALLLVSCLVAAYAGSYAWNAIFPEGGSRPTAKRNRTVSQPKENRATTPPGNQNQSSENRVANLAPKGTNAGSAAVAAGSVRGKRVLFVVPFQGLYFPDYGPVHDQLVSQGVEVTTVSSSTGICTQVPDTAGRQVEVKRHLNSVRAADFDAVIFSGYEVQEFVDGSAKNDTKRLIDEMLAGKKLVTALCSGQGVLAGHRILDGKRVALNNVTREKYPSRAIDTKQDVERDGQIITGYDATKASAFAQAVLSALRESR